MADPDLAKTAILQALFEVPRAARDAAWLERFYANVVEASFASAPQQVIAGPDGFPYFVLASPRPGEPFTRCSVSQVLTHCTDNGLGIVIDPTSAPPRWVFPYGALWSLRVHGQLTGDPQDEPAVGATGPETVTEPRQILVGSPAETLFPTWARAVVRTFLTQDVGIAEPSVCLVVDQNLKPSRNLVFNVFAEDFPGDPPRPLPFEVALRRLRWFLPPGRGLVAFPRGLLAASAFSPL